MKLHPIFSKEFYKWWILMALFVGLTYYLFGLPEMEGYEKYGLIFWILSTLFMSLIFGSVLYLIYRLFSGKWENRVYIKIIAIATVLMTFLYMKNRIFDFYNSVPQQNNTTRKYSEKSFKEQQSQSLYEYLDSTTNIYSNFKYHVAFDAPDDWKTDAGVSKHTIFRAFQPDSSLTFSINVIEIQLNENERDRKIDIWDFYQKNKEQMDYPFTKSIEEQLNTKVNNFTCQKSYIKNNICLKRKFNYTVKDLDLEYDVLTISYQTFITEFTYTFSLNIPKILYDENPEYYESFFRNVYFLKDGERLDNVIKESLKS
ncbi:MAG: hypothetical protein K0M40_04655 [Prolixibacteraceae bacterium]|nr:hypothetical protein [Prolixibacteraceae bacterium]